MSYPGGPDLGDIGQKGSRGLNQQLVLALESEGFKALDPVPSLHLIGRRGVVEDPVVAISV